MGIERPPGKSIEPPPGPNYIDELIDGPDLSEEQLKFIIDKGGAIAVQISDSMREELLKKKKATEEQIDRLSPEKAQYILLGAHFEFPDWLASQEQEEEGDEKRLPLLKDPEAAHLRERLQNSEKEYFEEYRQFLQSKVSEDEPEPGTLRVAREEYDALRGGYESKIRDLLLDVDRADETGDKLHKGNIQLTFARYQKHLDDFDEAHDAALAEVQREVAESRSKNAVEDNPVDAEGSEEAAEQEDEALAAKEYSLEVQKDLLAYQEEWTGKLSEARLEANQFSTSASALPFARIRAHALSLAEAYGEEQDSEKRQQLKEDLEEAVAQLKGPYTEAMRQEIEGLYAHAERVRASQKEVRDELSSLVNEHENINQQDAATAEEPSLDDEAPIQTTQGADEPEQRDLPEEPVLAGRPESPEEPAQETSRSASAERALERERRATAFAEKYNIGEERRQLLTAEEAFKARLAELYEEKRSPDKEDLAEAQKEYDEARLAWRIALRQATYDADPRDLIMARFIGVRDTAIRATEVRDSAREQALSERGRSTVQSVWEWAKNSTQKYGQASEAVGKRLGARKVVGLGSKIGALFGWKAPDQEENPEGYKEYYERNEARVQRASRIIGGAAIMSTAVAGGAFAAGTAGIVAGMSGAAALGALGTRFVLSLGRGTVGVILGAAAGGYAGKVYQELSTGRLERKNRAAEEAFAHEFRKKEDIGHKISVLDVKDLEREAETYSQGTRKAQRERIAHQEAIRQKIEVGTAAAVGGTAALGSGMFLNEGLFGNSEAVLRAEDTLREAQEQAAHATGQTQPDATPTPEPAQPEVTGVAEQTQAETTTDTPNRPQAAPAETAAVVPTPEALPEIRVGIEAGSGQGANYLFDEMEAKLRGELGNRNIESAPPAVQALLSDEYSPTELSQRFGFINEQGESLYMHGGDELRLNAENEIVFHDVERGDVVLIKADGSFNTAEARAAINDGQYQPVSEPAPVVDMQREAPPAQSDVQQSAPETSPAPTSETPSSIRATPSEPAVIAPEPVTVESGLPETVPSNGEPLAEPERIIPVEPIPDEMTTVKEDDGPIVGMPPIHMTDMPEASPDTSSSYEAEPSSEAPVVDVEESAEVSAQPERIIMSDAGVRINLDETHLYAVPDPTAGPRAQALIAYGGGTAADETFFARLQELARANPNQPVYFQSPIPTSINGMSQNYVAYAVYNPQTGFAATSSPDPSRPELIGVTLNPRSFTRLVN